MNNPSISINELETIVAKIIAKFKEDGIKNFEFSEDEYWTILSDVRYNFDQVPEPAVGSLMDDCDYLKDLVKNDVPVSYLELEGLSSILRAIGVRLLNS